MKKKRMTKAQALEHFHGNIVILRKKEKGRPNYGARLLAWRLFCKDLFLEGCISAKQRDGWKIPQSCRPQLPHQTEAEFIDDLLRLGTAKDSL